TLLRRVVGRVGAVPGEGEAGRRPEHMAVRVAGALRQGESGAAGICERRRTGTHHFSIDIWRNGRQQAAWRARAPRSFRLSELPRLTVERMRRLPDKCRQNPHTFRGVKMADRNWREEAKAVMAGADEAVVADLMKGAVDLHVHSGPSTMPRMLDHLEQVEEAAKAGMRGVLFKDYYYSVGPMLPMMRRLNPHPEVEMYGSLVLNTTVGGLNPYAVDFNLKSGTKMIFMPTAHAANHIRSNHR